MKLFILSFLFALVSFQTFAFDHDHLQWTKILKAHVEGHEETTVVDYEKLKNNPKELESYLKKLSSVSKKDYEQWSKSEKLAFLINAYNTFTLKLIIDHYPVKSIKDIGSLFTSPWKKEFFKLFGKKMHLDGIEHGMIRKDFNEPRIHFAVNCASIGCPSLKTEAFVASQLKKQLEEVAQDFLKDKSRNRYDAKTNTLFLSQIFEWYGDDFKEKGGVQAFVSTLMSEDPEIIKKIKSAKIKYLDYNWNLNKK